MFLIYDTETTGLPKNDQAPLTDFENWPRLIQLAWQLHDEDGEVIEVQNYLIKPEGFIIPRGAEKIHGISTERAEREGSDLHEVLEIFSKSLTRTNIIVGHNVEFDNTVMQVEFLRKEMPCSISDKIIIDTKEVSTEYCALPGGRGGKFKWPKLSELYFKLFQTDFDAAHNASADVQATARCFLELLRIDVVEPKMVNLPEATVQAFRESHPEPIQDIGLEVNSYYEEREPEEIVPVENVTKEIDSTAIPFTHLHVHTQFSVLDGLSKIPDLMKKAKEDGMKAVAITDHGNMFGVKSFHVEAKKAGLKPILGCEVYVAQRGMKLKENKMDGSGWHLILLAKNRQGYESLMTLVSAAWTEGYYYKPRIDKEFLKKHSEGLIALTACLGGEIPNKIMNEGVEKAEEALLEYKTIFGENLYLELQRHQSSDSEMNRRVYNDQVYVNAELMKMAKKHGLKVVATNDAHFINSEDAGAHDRLICIGTGKYLDDPNRLHYTEQEWFKTQQEMRKVFADVPEALENTQEVADKVEEYELDHEPIMPEFIIPEPFQNANEYLRDISYKGAKVRYGTITPELEERIDFELATIKTMGFPDYFLIVWDFLEAARKMGVAVGPGRGSAAGSVVAYSLKITQIDPLKYDLLFERFLNPERISMPDIDIDFDDDGREKVLHWVSEKYGKERVAHLITFGTMAAKSAIRDVARVQKLPLSEADRLAKMVPEKPGVSLKDALKEVPEFKKELEEGKPEIRSVIKNAMTLEGSVRNTGTHACGIIIAREHLDKYVPISTVKESVLDYATQYDGKYIESIGLLKMDFLGLKTLSIIKDALENIKRSKGIEVDIDNVSLDDKETYELYSRGETTALFQFESDGMKKYLRELKPTRFEDLIAMNALYRPGPMGYIPNFINRKHGREKIEYDLPMMEEILKETYGITVYQEQVMLLSRLMAGFTRGQSDSLRKAMGKKKIEEMNKLKIEYLDGCKKNGISEEKADKIWKDWAEFAKYAFNKSHATCYSYVSYQTAYLKAHYPAEFMAAVLSRNLSNIDKITFFIKEANRMGIQVLGPDINESALNFTVNKQGIIRFGLAAIKGVGGNAVLDIISEREENGPFQDIFDVIKRVNLKSVNKRSFEALAKAGAFDTFEDVHRSQYFFKENENSQGFLENLLKFGAKYKEDKLSTQTSLFGEEEAVDLEHPTVPLCDPWSVPIRLQNEKEVLGFYISGHPLDDYKITIQAACNTDIASVRNNMAEFKDKDITFAGMVTGFAQKATKRGTFFGVFSIEDFTGSMELRLFAEPYLKMKHLLVQGNNLFIRARVEGSVYDPNNLNINIKEIILLEDALGRTMNKLTLFFKPDEINDGLINHLKANVKASPGETDLYISIVDNQNNRPVRLKAKSSKVDAQILLNKLESTGAIHYSLSS